MGLRTDLNDKVFAGKGIARNINRTLLTDAPSAGSCPNSIVGEFVKDQTNDNWYLCTVAGTTWVKANA